MRKGYRALTAALIVLAMICGTPYLADAAVATEYEVTFHVIGTGGRLTATADGASITSGDFLARGTTIVFTWEADPGYAVDGVGKSSSGDTTWDESEEADGSITCTYLGSDIWFDVSFYYTGPTYTVTYNGNGHTGGTEPEDNTAYASGDWVTVLGIGDLVKTGYTFVEWNLAADGSDSGYYPDGEFQVGDFDVTLYAVWEEDYTSPSTYTVTFDFDGADFRPVVTYQIDGGTLMYVDFSNPDVTVPAGSTISYTFAEYAYENGETTDDTRWALDYVDVESPIEDIYDDWTVTGYYDTEHKVTFATDPTGTGAAVTYTVGSGTPTTYTMPLWVASGETLTYEYQNLVDVGDIYTFSYADPASPQTLTAPLEVTGYYCWYDQIFTGRGTGFWGNKNGQALLESTYDSAAELATALGALPLVNDDGSPTTFTPGRVYRDFSAWVNYKATAKNMSYMLSAQYGSMFLTVEAGFVDPDDVVYAPFLLDWVDGCHATIDGLDDNGFISVEDLMALAGQLLGQFPYTPAGHSHRALLECVKNALDNANSNQSLFAAPVCPTMPTCSWVGNWLFYDPYATPTYYYSFSVWSTATGVAGTWHYHGAFTGTVDGNVLTGTIGNGMGFELTLISCNEFVGTFDNEPIAGFRD